MFALTHEEQVSLQTAVIRVNEAERILTVNVIGASIFGYTVAELVGQHLEILIPDADKKRQSKAFKAAFTDPFRVVHANVVTALHKDGTKFPIRHYVGKVERNPETGAAAYFISLISRMIGTE